jgi:hypothetical protein
VEASIFFQILVVALAVEMGILRLMLADMADIMFPALHLMLQEEVGVAGVAVVAVEMDHLVELRFMEVEEALLLAQV